MEGISYVGRTEQFTLVVSYALAEKIVAALGYPGAIRDRIDARAWGDSKIDRFVLSPISWPPLERISWFDSIEFKAGYSTGARPYFGEFGDPRAVYEFGFWFHEVSPACSWLDPGRQ